MKNFKLFLLLAVAALVSCAKQEDPVTPVTPVYGDCTIQVAVDSVAAGTGYKHNFEIGEKFSVYDQTNAKVSTFAVSAVKAGVVSITGTIDLRQSKISLGYPAGRFSWADDGTFTIDPQIFQTTEPEALSEPAFYAVGATITSKTPVKIAPAESVVSVNVDVDNTCWVKLGLTDAEGEYKVYAKIPQDGELAKGKYNFVVPSGDYDSAELKCGTTFDREYTVEAKMSELSEGKGFDLGAESEGEKFVDYDILGESTISSIEELFENLGQFEGKSECYKNLFSGLLNLALDDGPVVTRSFSYTSADKDGNPVLLSGRLYIPQTVLEGQDADNICIANHHTIVCDSLCPSNNPYIHEALFAWKNSIVIMPDWHGFGVNSLAPQAFLDGMLIGRANVDAYDAAIQILKDEDIDTDLEVNNVGYSQGAIGAVGTLKYVAQNPDCGLKLAKTFSGGGPFDFRDCYKAILYGEGSHGPIDEYASNFIYLSIISINECEKLGLDYYSMFREPLASNVQSWILDKELTLESIIDSLGTQDPYEFLTHNLYWMVGSESKAVLAAADSYSLLSGWQVPEDSELYVFHSTQDDYIPFQSYIAFADALNSSSSEFTSLTGPFGAHFSAATPFILWALNNW